MPVRVEVPSRYVRRAQQLAEKRNRSFEQDCNWDNDANSYGIEAEERNYCGIMGEFAFAEYADLTIDANVYDITDGGEDFSVEFEGDRCKIDIKTAQKKPYALFVKEGCVSADYYIQGHLDRQSVEFLGMAAREDVLSTGLSETPYDHRNHEIPIEELEPIPEPETLKPVG